MKNTYLTGYFPLISILLFSSAFSIFTVGITTDFLTQAGILKGMLEFFSEQGIRLALFAAFALVYFMILSALKLIADTVLELALLFFAKDPEGELKENSDCIRCLFICQLACISVDAAAHSACWTFCISKSCLFYLDCGSHLSIAFYAEFDWIYDVYSAVLGDVFDRYFVLIY